MCLIFIRCMAQYRKEDQPMKFHTYFSYKVSQVEWCTRHWSLCPYLYGFISYVLLMFQLDTKPRETTMMTWTCKLWKMAIDTISFPDNRQCPFPHVKLNPALTSSSKKQEMTHTSRHSIHWQHAQTGIIHPHKNVEI